MPFIRPKDEEELSAQDAPALIGEDTPDPSNTSPAIPSIEIPEGVDTSPEHYKELLDKARGSEGTTLSDILALTPRGGRIASFLRGKSAKKMASAKAELEYLDKLYERGRQKQQLDFQSNADARAAAAEKREADKYSDERFNIAKGNDPNSAAAQLKREVAKQYFPRMAGVIDKMNSNDLDKNLPMLNQEFNAINARLEAQARLADTDAARALGQRNWEMTYQMQQDEKAAKRQDQVTEVENRKRNIIDSTDTVIQMIKDKGTFQAFGPHNETMRRLIDGMATDMAKLTDPGSVARPPEVEMWKKNLVDPTAMMTNKTAIQNLENFKNEVEKRTQKAYEVRKLTPMKPGGPSTMEDLSSEDVVRVQDPNGNIRPIPKANLPAALEAGGKVVR